MANKTLIAEIPHYSYKTILNHTFISCSIWKEDFPLVYGC